VEVGEEDMRMGELLFDEEKGLYSFSLRPGLVARCDSCHRVVRGGVVWVCRLCGSVFCGGCVHDKYCGRLCACFDGGGSNELVKAGLVEGGVR
jgi:hypothetical protein